MNHAVFDQAAAVLPSLFWKTRPVCGLILGSGWGSALTVDRLLAEVPYESIPGMGASTVVGHTGKIQLFERHGAPVIAFLGRRHWYEGVGWEPVVMPVELMRRIGVRNLLVTNAAGGITSRLQPGNLMIIRDHINTTGQNPLIGSHCPDWGVRFPDQSEIYSETFIDLLRKAAYDVGISLSDGVYGFTTGPCYETPAEIRAYAGMGADAIGMSTVPEVTIANACGFHIAGLSCITNMAAGISGPHLSHQEVLAQSKQSTPQMARLIDAFLQRLISSC